MDWKTSDALAILTIAGGVISFSVNAYQDREIKKVAHADKVRATAAQLLGKTSALRNAMPIAVLEIQQRVVDIKLKLLDRYDPRREMPVLYGTMLASEARALLQVSSVQTEPSYLEFYTFSPNTKKCVDAAVKRIESDLRQSYATVLDTVESARASLPVDKGQYDPANLYNKMSRPLALLELSSAGTMNKLLAPIERHLVDVIASANQRLNAETLQREGVHCE